MAELYWIDLDLLNEEFKKAHSQFNFYENLDYLLPDDKPAVGAWVHLKELKETDFINYKTGELRDPTSPLYFPLLLNYLAIIDKDSIKNLLTDLFKSITFQNRKIGYEYLSENYIRTFNQYRKTQPNIKLKSERLKQWLESKKSLMWAETPSQQEGNFFSLNDQLINKIVSRLLDENVIEENIMEDVKMFFKNDFSKGIALRMKKNKFVEFLSRAARENLQQAGDKKDFVKTLHKKILFIKGDKAQAMSFEYFYKLMTDEGKAPRKKFMLDYDFRLPVQK